MSDDDLDGMIRSWSGLGVFQAWDPAARARIYVALHDARLGPPVGGTRMRSYPSPREALRDAMRLAEGMTWKWASIDFGFGGGKCVVDVEEPLEGERRRSFFRRYGRLLAALDGAFSTGVDLGTDPEDMDQAAAETEHVFGRRPGGGGTVDPGPYTALGVHAGIRAALEARYGEPEPDGRRVLVQGVGDVGAPLARRLAEDGAAVLVADLDERRARTLATEVGGETVPPDEAYATECDVFAPCAVGGVIDDTSIPRLRCAVVAGSANNQLETAAHADALHERGILYAPDHVINAGGAMAFGLLHRGVADEDVLREQVRGLGERLREIFREASGADESPLHAARRVAERALEAAEGGGRATGPEASLRP